MGALRCEDTGCLEGTAPRQIPDRVAGSGQVVVRDRVHGMAFVGAFAELAAVIQAQLTKPPDDLPYEYACLAGVPYRTAYDALFTTAGLRPGEDLVVLGASGAVGSGAVAIGEALGARVIACASSPAKLEFCRKTGADEAVSYSESRFKETLKELTGGGADVVLDMVGGEYSEPALCATGYGGILELLPEGPRPWR